MPSGSQDPRNLTLASRLQLQRSKRNSARTAGNRSRGQASFAQSVVTRNSSSRNKTMNGTEWIVDARGCSADALRDLPTLRSLFAQIVADLGLRTIGEAHWHQFSGTGGITGLCLLSESHLACHTFPEFGSLCLNLFCCVPRSRWDFESQLSARFLATSTRVSSIEREYSSALVIPEMLGIAGENR